MLIEIFIRFGIILFTTNPVQPLLRLWRDTQCLDPDVHVAAGPVYNIGTQEDGPIETGLNNLLE